MKKFKFELEIEDIPYSPETVKQLFGQEAEYNADYPEHVMASEKIHDLIRDAIQQVLHLKMLFFTQNKIDRIETLTEPNKSFWEYLCRKESEYLKIEKTVKCVIEIDTQEKLLEHFGKPPDDPEKEIYELTNKIMLQDTPGIVRIEG